MEKNYEYEIELLKTERYNTFGPARYYFCRVFREGELIGQSLEYVGAKQAVDITAECFIPENTTYRLNQSFAFVPFHRYIQTWYELAKN